MPEADRIVPRKELASMVPYSAVHIWRLEQRGEFPKRIKVGAHRVGWSLREILEWIEARKNLRAA